MPRSEQCPDPELFVGFLTGNLEDAQVDQIEAHLATCAPCGDTVRSMDVSDTMCDLVRDSQTDEPLTRPDLEELIGRLDKLADSNSEDPAATAPDEDLLIRVHEVGALLDPPTGEGEIGRIAHYRILRVLGAGGMGVVYQAEDVQLQRLVALKILRPSLGQVARDRFLQEARAAAAIDHDHVVTIFHVGSEGPLAFLAMQWLDGETLESRLASDKRLAPDEVISIASQIAEGLAAAHAKKLIHRDIKPANIWLESDRNRARILDFGLARVADDSPQLTETGMIAGTPAYMSPEQSQGRSVDERSDLFSLGTMMYRMLTGKLPFERTNALATIRSIQEDSPPSPRQVDLEIPVVLSDTVMDLLEKDARCRPGTAQAVSECLREGKRPPCTKLAVPKIGDVSRGRRIGTLIPVLVALSAFATAPFIYRIATDYGHVVIESEDPNVKVELAQGGAVVKVLGPTGEDFISVRAGEYDVQLEGKPSHLILKQDRLSLTRHDRKKLTITRVTDGPKVTQEDDDFGIANEVLKRFELRHANSSVAEVTLRDIMSDGSGRIVSDPRTNSLIVVGSQEVIDRVAELIATLDLPDSATHSQPLFSGKPYQQWLNELLVENNPAELPKAVNAVRALTDASNHERTGRAVFDVARRVCEPFTDRHDGSELTKTCMQVIYDIDPSISAKLVAQALDQDEKRSRSFVRWLWEFARESGFWEPYSEYSTFICRRLTELSEQPENRVWAAQALVLFSTHAEVDSDQVEEVLRILEKQLVEPLFEQDSSEQINQIRERAAWLSAAAAITELAPGSSLVLEKLNSSLQQAVDAWSERSDWREVDGELDAITKIGPAAKPLVPLLVERLSRNVSEIDVGLGPGTFQINNEDEAIAVIALLGQLGAQEALPLVAKFARSQPLPMGIKNAARDALSKLQQGPTKRAVVEGGNDHPPTEDQPTMELERLYDGRAYELWVYVLDSETSAARLTQALVALSALTDDTNSATTSERVYRIAEQYGNSNRSDELTAAALRAIYSVDSDTKRQFVLRVLQEGNERARAFLKALWRQPAYHDDSFPERFESEKVAFWETLAVAHREICERLLKLTETSETRIWAIEMLCRFCWHVQVDLAQVAGVMDVLESQLTDPEIAEGDFKRRMQSLKSAKNDAAWAIANVAPNSPLLLKTLQASLELAATGDRRQRENLRSELAIIGRLGPFAEPLVPALVALRSRMISVRGKQIHPTPRQNGIHWINALSSIGAAAEPALPSLKQLTDDALSDQGTGIKAAARAAIETIESAIAAAK